MSRINTGVDTACDRCEGEEEVGLPGPVREGDVMHTVSRDDLLRRLRSLDDEIARAEDVLVKLDLLQERVMLREVLAGEAGALVARRTA
ncbi:MAG: hypothetical protein JWN67_3250 [Actinomycetia bacterium]|nr:hypothetical protein [Actinomycetes bacterium]